ncbi:MAG: glutamate racemase [Bacilli bacterium]|nr:glutamate racemase [Bacilli bacterium]
MNKIGVFDSGIGGITVLKEIIKLIPNYEYVYYSDSFNNPYGNKTKEELYVIVKNVIDKLIMMDCNIIVIACNTASAICVDDIREEYKDIIIVAVEPAIKMINDYGHTDNVLLLATKGTVESTRFKNLYEKYNNNNTYVYTPLNLASLIEEGNSRKINECLKVELRGFVDKEINVVILGCTHYPLVKDKIKKILGNQIFYDGSIGVAKRVKSFIKEETKFKITFIDSSNSKEKEIRFFDLLSKK